MRLEYLGRGNMQTFIDNLLFNEVLALARPDQSI